MQRKKTRQKVGSNQHKESTQVYVKMKARFFYMFLMTVSILLALASTMRYSDTHQIEYALLFFVCLVQATIFVKFIKDEE